MIEYYQDKAGEWRWRSKSVNGQIVADSSEGYSTKQGAERGAAAAAKSLATLGGINLAITLPDDTLQDAIVGAIRRIKGRAWALRAQGAIVTAVIVAIALAAGYATGQATDIFCR